MTEILARLATVSGLTTAGQVRWGYTETPPTVPFACAWLGETSSEHGPDLTAYRRSVTVQGLVYVASSQDTPQSREAAAADMLDLVMAALEGSDPTLGGNLTAGAAVVSATSFEGSGPWADRGVVAWELSGAYIMAQGSGS